MALIVDIRHLLDANGELPTANLQLRQQALRVARLIEYGGPLQVGEFRETLVECSARPKRRPCLGLMWIQKTDDQRLDAYCLVCRRDHVVISGWEETQWAEGPMEPASDDVFAPDAIVN